MGPHLHDHPTMQPSNWLVNSLKVGDASARLWFYSKRGLCLLSEFFCDFLGVARVPISFEINFS